MNAPAPPRLAPIGKLWDSMITGTDEMVARLRRVHGQMADALDRDAQQAVEGVKDWRTKQGRFE